MVLWKVTLNLLLVQGHHKVCSARERLASIEFLIWSHSNYCATGLQNIYVKVVQLLSFLLVDLSSR